MAVLKELPPAMNGGIRRFNVPLPDLSGAANHVSDGRKNA